ncbi:MAG: FIST signal transduction protein [Rubrivivax sp.]|jgi:small ligand-binding sensory domain FIST
MKPSAFLVGHATHPDWRMALAMAAAQLDAQAAAAPHGTPPASLGLIYFTDAYADQAQALHQALHDRWPGVRWAGCAAIGVAASGVEYFDEPALVIMLCPLAPGSFEVYSGTRPLGAAGAASAAHTALVHADPATTDLGELVTELSERVATGYLFGGLVSSRAGAMQVAEGVFDGGLSGVAFGPGVALVSRVTQGCQPVGPERVITAADGPLVLTLDGRPALPCLLEDLGITLDDPRKAMPVLRATLVGLTDADAALLGRGGQFGPDVRARHLIGLDPARQAVAVAERVEPGMRLAFSQRHTEAARRDLVRICSEIRDEVESDDSGPDPAGDARRILGAIYVSCNGRGGPHFGAPSAELKIVQRALGDVPLAGFFAAGEIARRHLYGYTGVLTVFTSR